MYIEAERNCRFKFLQLRGRSAASFVAESGTGEQISAPLERIDVQKRILAVRRADI